MKEMKPVNYNKLTPTERRNIREQYMGHQRFKCYHCGGDLHMAPPPEMRNMPIKKSLFPPGFFQHPVHLHHDHSTGMTIGAVHNICNAILWQYHGE